MIKYIGIAIIIVALFNMYFKHSSNDVLNNKAVAAVSLGSAVTYNNNREILPPKPPSPTGHKRADCPTGGWIVHGDSHKTRCPECQPSWETGSKKYKLTLQDKNLSWKTTNKKCCPDCKCEVCKYCMYPGECLVKANDGKDVIIYEERCDESKGICTRVPVRKYSKGKPIFVYPQPISKEMPVIIKSNKKNWSSYR